MKLIRLRLISAILSALAFTFIFCGCSRTININAFYNKLNLANSAEIVITMYDVPGYGTISNTMRIQNNKMYQSAFLTMPEKYMEIVDDKIYTYTNIYGDVWERDDGEPLEEEFINGNEDFIDLFNGKNYYYLQEEDCFKIKEDADVNFFDLNVETFYLTIKGNCCEFTAETNFSGVIVDLSVEIKKLGSVTVTLPEI